MRRFFSRFGGQAVSEMRTKPGYEKAPLALVQAHFADKSVILFSADDTTAFSCSNGRGANVAVGGGNARNSRRDLPVPAQSLRTLSKALAQKLGYKSRLRGSQWADLELKKNGQRTKKRKHGLG